MKTLRVKHHGERREKMPGMTNSRKAQLVFLAGFFTLMFIANLPPKRNELPEFPKPDPEKGTSLGWNFKEQEYRYASEYQGERLPAGRANAPKAKPTRVRHGLKITSLEDIKSLEDLNDYIDKRSSRTIIYRDYEMTEDEAEDILDYRR
jgi:hypothetical protein